jgi:hypothetical protein
MAPGGGLGYQALARVGGSANPDPRVPESIVWAEIQIKVPDDWDSTPIHVNVMEAAWLEAGASAGADAFVGADVILTPEPASALLLLVGLPLVRRRRR